MKKYILILLLLLPLQLFGAEYYVWEDCPAGGANDGTSRFDAWTKLDSVFSTKRYFVDEDTLYFIGENYWTASGGTKYIGINTAGTFTIMGLDDAIIKNTAAGNYFFNFYPNHADAIVKVYDIKFFANLECHFGTSGDGDAYFYNCDIIAKSGSRMEVRLYAAYNYLSYSSIMWDGTSTSNYCRSKTIAGDHASFITKTNMYTGDDALIKLTNVYTATFNNSLFVLYDGTDNYFALSGGTFSGDYNLFIGDDAMPAGTGDNCKNFSTYEAIFVRNYIPIPKFQTKPQSFLPSGLSVGAHEPTSIIMGAWE